MCLEFFSALQLVSLMGVIFFFPLLFLHPALKNTGKVFNEPVKEAVLPLKKYGVFVMYLGAVVYFSFYMVMRHPYILFLLCFLCFLVSRYFLFNCN